MLWARTGNRRYIWMDWWIWNNPSLSLILTTAMLSYSLLVFTGAGVWSHIISLFSQHGRVIIFCICFCLSLFITDVSTYISVHYTTHVPLIPVVVIGMAKPVELGWRFDLLWFPPSLLMDTFYSCRAGLVGFPCILIFCKDIQMERVNILLWYVIERRSDISCLLPTSKFQGRKTSQCKAERERE